jgi:hypothetical protein
MSDQTSANFQLEILEPRETPAATVRSVAGTLFIRGDNTPNGVVLVENAPGQFDVTVNAAFQGTFAARNINIVMGNANDTVDLAVKTALPGYLRVHLGDGNDTFTTRNSVVGAKIRGPVNIFTGKNHAIASGIEEDIELYNLHFVGPYVSVSGVPGRGAENLDLEGCFISGPLYVRNMQRIQFGKEDDNTRAVNLTSVYVDNRQHNFDTRVNPLAGPGNLVFFFSGSKIARDFVYWGGAGRDELNLPADPGGAVEDVYIGRNLTVYGGSGIGSLSLGNGLGFGAKIGGNVTFIGGNAVDRFFLDSGSVVGGNVFVDLRGGDDQVFGDTTTLGTGPFNPSGSALVGGNLVVHLGAGNNFVGSYLAGSSLQVGGHFYIVCAGPNTTLGGDATTPGAIDILNGNVTVGGRFMFRSDGVNQTFNVLDPNVNKVIIVFGGGSNTVNFLVPNFFGDVYVNFGHYQPGTKAFEIDGIATVFHGILTVLFENTGVIVP